MTHSQVFLAALRHGLALFGLCLAPLAQAEATLTLHYNDRVPYMTSQDDGEVSGLTATPAAQALRRAGIAFRWEKTPSNRQVQILEKNSGDDCMLGWFNNPERELIGNFSHPLYQDKPTIGLALFSNINIDSGISLEQALHDKQLRLLVKDGYSYGAVIDGLIQRLKPQLIKTTVENNNMLRMVALDRADYFFIAEEEATELIRQSEFKPGDFKYIQFSDSPPGGRRHLWCSKRVSPQQLDKINQAIDALTADAPWRSQPQ